MAKITITIEDTFDGKVKVVSDPTFMTMASMVNSGESMKSSHGYALAVIKRIRELSKEQGSLIMPIPKVTGL